MLTRNQTVDQQHWWRRTPKI